MGLRFRKTIKISDFLKINLSKSGISFTVGKKGASLTLGKKRTSVNVSPTVLGVKGTGISYNQKIGNGYSGIVEKAGEAIEKISDKSEDGADEE